MTRRHEETCRALRLADRFAKGNHLVICFLHAGDFCRVSGDLDEAEKY